MKNILPFKPIKGKAFRLYVSLQGIESEDRRAIWSHEDVGNATWKIIKDGGSESDLTNSPVSTFRGNGYIELTADEMNADSITIHGYRYDRSHALNHYGFMSTTDIYTQENELANVPDKDSSLSEKVTAIFQYLFFRRSVDNFNETLFKSDDTTELGTAEVTDQGNTVTKGRVT